MEGDNILGNEALGYRLGAAGYYKNSDKSGPYVFDGVSTFTLMGAAPLRTAAALSSAIITNAGLTAEVAVVAAVASQTTRIYRLKLSVAGATIVTIKDGAGGTTLEKFNFSGNGGGFILDLSAEPWYVTSVNKAFIIQSSAAVQVDGRAEYLTS